MTTLTEDNYFEPELPIFTSKAAKKVQELIEEEENPDLNLRIYITGGGCSGFKYNFTFDDIINEDDTIVEEEDDGSNGSSGSTSQVKLLIDPASLQYLMGAKIDYRDDQDGEQFVISNPNAKTTCGCGSSFG